jgi:hypothetical protein
MPIPNKPEIAVIAKQITELEHRLKSLMKSSQPDEKSMRPVRISLRDSYEKLLLLDHKYATESQVEQSLWKLVFYKRIEDYRKRHSKMCAAIQDSEKKERATEALKSVNESFSRFLEDSKKFYLALLQKLLDLCGIYLPGYSEGILSGAGCGLKEEIMWSCHRCLIYLGDLDRYAQLYIESGQGDWSIPERHYEAAAMLLPHVGNPHNQKAVLATYRADDLQGVYMYGRALLCTSPFVTAQENLAILFEKNRQNCRELLVNKFGNKRGALDARTKRRNDFCSRFVRVLGILWTKVDMDEYRMIESALLTEFVSLLDSGDVDGSPLIMMVASTIFIVSHLEKLAKDQDEGSIDRLNKDYCFEFATALAFKMFCRVCVSARAREGQIAAMCIFTDWLRFNTHLISPSGLDNQNLNKDVRVARQSFIENLVDFLNLTSTLGLQPVDSHPLPEDLELMGFLPLASAHQHIQPLLANSTLQALREDAAALDAASLKFLRVQKLEDFANRLASGPRPVLFYDSQSGEYSVEGSGVFNLIMPPGADNVQSQQRGKGSATNAGRGGSANKDTRRIPKESNGVPRRKDAAPPTKKAAVPQTAIGFGRQQSEPAPITSMAPAFVDSSSAPCTRDEQPLAEDVVADGAFMNGEEFNDMDGEDFNDDETFGDSIACEPVPDDFTSLAHSAAAFAAASSLDRAQSPDQEAPDSRRPEEAEEVSDNYLELLVRKAIGSEVAAGSDATVPPRAAQGDMDMEADDLEQEEIILFKPTGKAAHESAGVPRAAELPAASTRLMAPVDFRAATLHPGSSIGDSGAYAPRGYAVSPEIGTGHGAVPAAGPWGASTVNYSEGAAVRSSWASDAAVTGSYGGAGQPEEMVDRSRTTSRFVTRNPFAMTTLSDG